MMARRGLEVAGLVLVVAATTLCTLCSAQTTATVQPMTMPTCAPVPISLSPCIGYAFGVGSATLSGCCSQLQAFFQSQGPCLCAMSKLAPSPFGLVLGQVQGMIPNVCNLPSNPCDDVATSPEASTPPEANATAPATPPDPTASTAPVTTPVATPAAPATTDASGAPPVSGDDSPAAVAASGQVAPEGAGSNTGSQAATKLPELPHAAGARSSRDMSAGTVLITLFLAYVSTMHV